MNTKLERGTEIDEVWSRYRATGERELRDRIVLSYLPLVRHIAYRKVRELPAWCEVDDLISSGIEGLIGAIDRYDPSKGATLEQFVWTRIQGAVLDDLRKVDWAPRSLRRREREIDRAREACVLANGRQPSTPDLAEAMDVEVGELEEWLRDLAASDLGSLNEVTATEEDGLVEIVQTVRCSDERLDPAHAATDTLAKERFRRAFAHLPERERRVAVMLYGADRTLQEIGDDLGVSESRVCQIHGELKKRLRASLRRDTELFSATA
jgi:RNA polymerase sigma factor for flagellar operon FliA